MVKSEIIPCTREEIDALINAAIADDFFYLLFKVARKTGRRIGEYYDVKVRDIDFERKVMTTKVLKRRKKVEKEAILDDDLLYLLQRYVLKEKLKLDDYVFRKLSIRQIQNKVKYYAVKAGIQHNVVFHNFRHYFITALSRKGWTHEKIAKLTGHSTPQTLNLYDHTVAGDIADEARHEIKDL